MADTVRRQTHDLSRLNDALARIDREVTQGIEKGLPDTAVVPANVAQQGWNLLRGDLPMPSMLLRRAALDHNIAHMQAYCDRSGAWFAPHGKTTMAPKLFRDQLQAGAWAITVANIAQLQVCRTFGIGRVYFANEVATAYDAQYLANQLAAHPEAEIYVTIDSAMGVDLLVAALRAVAPTRPQRVLIDFGMRGGRTGVRTLDGVIALARLIRAEAPYLELVGIHGYEGIAAGDTREARLAAADDYLQRLRQAALALCEVVPAAPFLVCAGGSQYFDRVVEFLGAASLPGCQLILRSGGYVTHDSSFFDKTSPFGAHSWRQLPGENLIPAIEIWSAVLSVPEPRLAILGMGGRDMPTDIELPVPLFRSRGGTVPVRLDVQCRITRSNDQHAYLSFPDSEDMQVGDLIGCGISHPCTAFDKWRAIFVVDDDYRVADLVRTYF